MPHKDASVRRSCLRAGEARARARNKEITDAARNAPCMDCGGVFPVVCMDFDHVRGEKKRAVSNMVYNHASEARLRSEIAKCDVVCSNCHRIRTLKRGQYRGRR